MTDISFTPTFKHLTWVDNRDRVAAGGPNGFNVRFEALQKDLENLATVIGKVKSAIEAVSAQPPVQRLLSLTPAFVPMPPNKAWAMDPLGVAVRPSTETSVKGLITLSPPDGVKLLKFRAIGKNTGSGNLRISLFRAPVADGSVTELLARIPGEGAYDEQRPIEAGKDRVDMTSFRYFVIADLSNATTGDTVTVISIQLSYLID
ncbi:hypothetical protein [Streptomyces albus]|uniref:hypothetical protein n=1 Tax=Streptomyces albus TaxID=1888 RepID=UPI0006E194F1|nr:hypothetical protein [Streptomyces albus]